MSAFQSLAPRPPKRYVDDFEQKWVLDDAACSEELLGAADIQSLADLGNSYAFVRDMRPVPFGLGENSRRGKRGAAVAAARREMSSQ